MQLKKKIKVFLLVGFFFCFPFVSEAAVSFSGTVDSDGTLHVTGINCFTGDYNGTGIVKVTGGPIFQGSAAVSGYTGACPQTGGYLAGSLEAYASGDGTYRIYMLFSSSGAFSSCGGSPSTCDSGSRYYFEAIRSGGVWNLPPPPASGATLTTAFAVATSTMEIQGVYTNSNTFNRLQMEVYNLSLGTYVAVPQYVLPSGNFTIVGQPYTVDRYVPFLGRYSVRVRLYDTSNGSSTPYTSPLTFGFGTTTIASSTSPWSINGSNEVSCDTFDVGCYIKGAFVWLFSPSPESTSQFTSLSLSESFPFSYAFDTGIVFSELFGATSTATTTISVAIPWLNHSTTTITFLSAAMIQAVPYSSTMRTIIGYTLWLALAFMVYRKVISAHDVVTKV